MGVLQDKCPEESFETIKAIVSKELDFDNTFASFEEKPIGAASIGQGGSLLYLLGYLVTCLCVLIRAWQFVAFPT